MSTGYLIAIFALGALLGGSWAVSVYSREVARLRSRLIYTHAIVAAAEMMLRAEAEHEDEAFEKWKDELDMKLAEYRAELWVSRMAP